MPIAQMNVARALFDYEEPQMAGFLSLVDYVNAAADAAKGFIWRLADGSGSLNRGRDPREIVNLSVWESTDALRDFTWSGIHGRATQRKATWFVELPKPYLVLWPVAYGHHPTLDEGYMKLTLLKERGPSAEAFDWEWLRVRSMDSQIRSY